MEEMIQSWYCSFKNLKTSDFVAGEVCQKRDECLVKMPPSAGAGRC
jgi:phage terminase large subunit-like protein